MNELYSYEEYKKECLKNVYTRNCYKNDNNYESRMKKSYERYVFRYNALQKAKEYENEINEKYNKIKK